MKEKLIEKTTEKIEEILEQDINSNNLDYLYKLVDIYKDIKEVECMYYGNYYGRRPDYDSYGREYYGEYEHDSYGRRGYDKKYRGHEHLDRISDDYGRYMKNRERYGANEETSKSFHYMIKALEDFIKVLYEEADNESQKSQLRETLQRSIM